MPAKIPKPQYSVTLEGQTYGVQFDTNISDTKRGITISFYPPTQILDPAQLNDIANKIAIVLQKKFANYGIQVDRDTQVQNQSVIRFTIPLISISDFIMKKVIQGA